MYFITLFLNSLLECSFRSFFGRKLQLEKLVDILPFQLPSSEQIAVAIDHFSKISRFKDFKLQAVVPMGIMAQRKEENNTQSEFEGVYVAKVYFGRELFGVIYIFSDGTWREIEYVDFPEVTNEQS